MRSAFLLVLAFASTGCLGAEPSEDALDDSLGVEGKADGSEQRVRAEGTTLWVDSATPVRLVDGEVVLTIRGRTSRNLEHVLSFVPDDAFGSVDLVGPRSFEIELHAGSELNTILSGLPLFVALSFTSGAQRNLVARLEVAPLLGAFRGSRDVFVEAPIDAIYVGGDAPLRYRAHVTGDSRDLVVVGASPAITTISSREAAIDFTYEDLELAYDRGTPLVFRDRRGHEKRATLGAGVTSLTMAAGDAYELWPSRCERDVFECVSATEGESLVACGTYRQVQRCVRADVCDVLDVAPLSLAPVNLGWAFASALGEYSAHCHESDAWCDFGGLTTYAIPECMAEPASLEAIVASTLKKRDLAGGIDVSALRFESGRVIDREHLEETPFFSYTYSAGGPGLFRAIDAHMAAGRAEAWLYSIEVATDHGEKMEDVLVLYYPDAFRVVVLEGVHGATS